MQLSHLSQEITIEFFVVLLRTILPFDWGEIHARTVTTIWMDYAVYQAAAFCVFVSVCSLSFRYVPYKQKIYMREVADGCTFVAAAKPRSLVVWIAGATRLSSWGTQFRIVMTRVHSILPHARRVPMCVH